MGSSQGKKSWVTFLGRSQVIASNMAPFLPRPLSLPTESRDWDWSIPPLPLTHQSWWGSFMAHGFLLPPVRRPLHSSPLLTNLVWPQSTVFTVVLAFALDRVLHVSLWLSFDSVPLRLSWTPPALAHALVLRGQSVYCCVACGLSGEFYDWHDSSLTI